jgi:hypothetical protein
MVEWEDGSITAEPLAMVAADDPISCAIYAKQNDLLDSPHQDGDSSREFPNGKISSYVLW